jgi:lipopolysaccharide export LptBFGC system permease protein LptF
MAALLRLVAYTGPFIASWLACNGYDHSNAFQAIVYVSCGALFAVVLWCSLSGVEEVAVASIMLFFLALLLAPTLLTS